MGSSIDIDNPNLITQLLLGCMAIGIFVAVLVGVFRHYRNKRAEAAKQRRRHEIWVNDTVYDNGMPVPFYDCNCH